MRRDGTIFIDSAGRVDGRPREGAETPAGWIARIAAGPDRGTAIAAERWFEDLHGLILARGLPRRGTPVSAAPVDDFAAATREVLMFERRALRRAMETGGLIGTVAGVLGAILLAWALL